MRDPRGPWDVPDPERPRTDGPGTFDTDGDGVTDTAVTDDGFDLVIGTDLDGDGLADQVLRIGPDGVVHHVLAPDPGPYDAGLPADPHD